MTALVDVEAIGSFLRDHGGYGCISNDPTVSYLKLRETGPVVALLHVDDGDLDLDPGLSTGPADSAAGGPDHGLWAPISARWVETAKGRRLERRLNNGHPGPVGGHRRSLDRPGAEHAKPAILAEELGILFTRFPHDRRLRSLPVAVDGPSMVDHLRPVLEPTAGGAAIAAVEVVPVRYKPEGQCVLRFEVEWAGPAAPPPLSFYGKITKPSAFDRAVAMQATVASVGATCGFGVPRSLGTVHDLSLELLSIVPGVQLSEIIGGEFGKGVGADVGHALLTLHDAPISLSRRITVDDRIELVVDNAKQLALYVPDEASRVSGLVSAVVDRMSSLAPVVLRPTHHDFHGRNVLVDHTSLGLLDFDDLALGDPADDVGSMYAHLVELAALNPRRARAIAVERSAFLAAYLERNGDGGRRRDGDRPATAIGEDRCIVHGAAHCLLLAYQALRHPGPASPCRIRAMLDEAEALLSRGLT